VFVPAFSLFLFEGKDRSLSLELVFYISRLWPYCKKMRLDRKGFPGANTLAYLLAASVASKKSLTRWTQGQTDDLNGNRERQKVLWLHKSQEL